MFGKMRRGKLLEISKKKQLTRISFDFDQKFNLNPAVNPAEALLVTVSETDTLFPEVVVPVAFLV
jgi:hypothetical protein